jgi:hypothetical protein
MATTTIIWLVTLGVKLLAALVGLFVACAKFVDWRRQKHVPVELTSRAYRAAGTMHSAQRPAPVMAGKRTEKVAKFADASPYMKTGDILTFSGRSVWSYILRIGTFSDKSHCGMVVRDDESIWVVDSCEGRNVTKRPLFEEVKKYPGQWYWHQIRHEFCQNYHRQRAADYFFALIANKTKYGWLGIVFQSFIRLPVLREIAYLTRLDQLPIYGSPFCSHADKDAMKAGSLDPVPGRAANS